MFVCTTLFSLETNLLLTTEFNYLSLKNVLSGLLNSAPTPLWNPWLAGLIDGGGCFLLSKYGYARLEITMDARDLCALELIQAEYGGHIHFGSRLNSYRYR
jgi:hypothetical protein